MVSISIGEASKSEGGCIDCGGCVGRWVVSNGVAECVVSNEWVRWWIDGDTVRLEGSGVGSGAGRYSGREKGEEGDNLGHDVIFTIHPP